MKRFLCALMALCLCIALTACGDAEPKEKEELIKIVVVCEGDDMVETSQAAVYKAELQTVAQTLGIGNDQLTICDGVDDADSTYAEAAMRSYIKDGYSVVFATSEGYAAATKKLAVEFPEVSFIQIGDADETLPNFYAYRLKAYEGAYLCGLVAGELAENGILGMLAADIDSVQTHQLANAFLLGARVRNPQATLIVAKADATNSATVVASLQRQACEGVLITNDCKETVSAAHNVAMRIYTVFGRYDADDIASYSVTVQHRNQLTDTLQGVLSDITPYYNNMFVGYADGFLRCVRGFEQDGDTTDVFVRAAQALLSKGTWDVFSGNTLSWDGTVQAFAQTPTAVKDTQGSIRIDAGMGMPSMELLNSMNWWMEGITVQ